MRQNKIFSARFANNPRIASVQFEVFSNGLPQMAKYSCRACEVQSCEISVFEDHVASNGTIASDHVDDSIWEPSFLENFHDDLGTVYLSI